MNRIALALSVVALAASLAACAPESDTTTAGASPSSSAKSKTTTPAKPKAATKAPPKVAGLNQPVRDGGLEFTIKSVQCGKSEIGSEGFTKKAQGQFCLINMHVSNIGKDSKMLNGSSQRAFDAQGRKFDADSGAAMYLGDQAQTFLNDINPGNSVNGTVVFDIPKGVKITQLELHDSIFSGGVKVKVA